MLRFMVVSCAAPALAASLAIGVAGHALHLDPEWIDDLEAQHAETVDTEQLQRQMINEYEARFAAMWETGEFEMDHGGMIPLEVLKRAPEVSRSRTRLGPFPPAPIRRDTFDAWCDRIGISDVAPAELLEAIWTDYADRMNQILLTQYPPIYNLSYSLGAVPGPLPHGDVPLLEEMITLLERARDTVNRTEDRLFRMLSTIEQGHFAGDVESWHLYRRWERAAVWTITVSGARIHVSRLLETAEVQWPNRHIRAAYEMEIARAAERRELHNLSTTVRLAENRAAMFYNRFGERHELGSPELQEARADYQRNSTPLLRQRWQHKHELYNINSRYIMLLSMLLERVDAERVYDAFTSHMLPKYFPNQYDLRSWFDRILESNAISRTLRRNVTELREMYVTVQRGVDNALIRTIHSHEADLTITRIRNPAKQARQQREIDAEMQRRYDNAVIFASHLVELLEDEERFAWVQEELEELLDTDLTRRW